MATTTGLQIITDALGEIGVIGEGETPNANMVALGLRVLNRMLDSLSNNSSWGYFVSTESYALTGQAFFTIGPTGDVVAPRPIAIETATVVVNGITYPVKVIDNERYDILTYKALTGAYTAAIYYEPTYPNGTVYCYPICSDATLNMRVSESVKQFANELVQIDMPEGYEDAIVLNLATRLARSYGREVSKDLKMDAIKAMKAVTKTNTVIPTLELPEAVMGKSGGSYAAFMSGG
jgi:hypothetical protein